MKKEIYYFIRNLVVSHVSHMIIEVSLEIPSADNLGLYKMMPVGETI